jgi:flagellar protein FlaJ
MRENPPQITEQTKKAAKKSFLEKTIMKKASIREKEMQKLKFDSLKLSIFIALFIWLIVGVIVKNALLGGGIACLAAALIFVLLIQIPIAKKKKYTTKVEADLPIFLMRLATELRIGKSFSRAISDSCKEDSAASKEFEKVLGDMRKGMSFAQALQNMNERMDSITIRRVTSNLSNLSTQGTRDFTGLKKVVEELLVKQRIESKEFSGKMVVYALVFIAISAIVPAMFQSFILIGSYFMSISFTAQQAFLISVILFPVIDLTVLMLIDSKTPIFLKQ